MQYYYFNVFAVKKQLHFLNTYYIRNWRRQAKKICVDPGVLLGYNIRLFGEIYEL